MGKGRSSVAVQVFRGCFASARRLRLRFVCIFRLMMSRGLINLIYHNQTHRTFISLNHFPSFFVMFF